MSWLLFQGEISDGLLVCHKCDNRACVNPAHLFLGTTQDNVNDRVLKERGNAAIGSQLPQTKMTPEKVAFIRDSFAKGVSQRVLALQFGMSQQGISNICRRQCWEYLA